MAIQAERKREDAPIIPDRLYFKIGDVAKLCGLEAYVLRFWETQFPQLKPNKSGTGQRLYRRRDVEMVLEIKRLVHGEGYTLTGARQALDQGVRRKAPEQTPLKAINRQSDAAGAIGRIRAELREIAGMLAAPAATVAPAPPRRRTRFAAVASGELFS